MMGMFGGNLNLDTSVGQPLQMPAPDAQPKKKGGMFGSGMGIGEILVTALNGYLAGRGNPVGIANLRMMQDRQHQATEDRRYQQHRTDALADWMAQQQYKAANPDPGAPHYFETNSGDQMMIGPDGQPQEVYHDPMRYKFVPNGMGGVVPVDISTLMGGQGPQQAPQGVTFTPINEGGPMPQASGGFR